MRRRWVRWVVALVIVFVLIGIGTKAAIGAVQDPFLISAQAQESDGWHYALYVVKRAPSTADVESDVQQFAKKYPERPLIAEFYTDGAAAASVEAGGPADTPDTAAVHVGEFRRPASGNGQGWADAKGAGDAGKVTFQAP